MNRVAKISIVFKYDLDSFRFMTGEDIPEADFKQAVMDYVYEDITELMRTEPLENWAEIEISDSDE